MFGFLVGLFFAIVFLIGVVIAFLAGMCYSDKEMRKKVKRWYDKFVD